MLSILLAIWASMWVDVSAAYDMTVTDVTFASQSLVVQPCLESSLSSSHRISLQPLTTLAKKLPGLSKEDTINILERRESKCEN